MQLHPDCMHLLLHQKPCRATQKRLNLLAECMKIGADDTFSAISRIFFSGNVG